MSNSGPLSKAAGLLLILIGVFLILAFRFVGLPLSAVGLILLPVGFSVYHRRVSWLAFGFLFVILGISLALGLLLGANAHLLGVMGIVLGLAFIALGAITIWRATRPPKAAVAKKNPRIWTAEDRN